MTTPSLNRIFTVSGSSSETTRFPIRWGFNKRIDSGFPLEAGEWYAADGSFNRVPASIVTAQQFLDWTMLDSRVYFEVDSQSVESDGGFQLDVIALGAVLGIPDEGRWLRITTPDAGESYLQFSVVFTRTSEGTNSFSANSGELIGSDFDLGPTTYTQFLFQRHEADQTIQTTQDMRVWGEMLERGSVLGVVTIGTEQPATTGSQEEGTVIVRYDPALAIGTSLMDDLGREWEIRGTRALANRRFLEFDLVRNVAAV